MDLALNLTMLVVGLLSIYVFRLEKRIKELEKSLKD